MSPLVGSLICTIEERGGKGSPAQLWASGASLPLDTCAGHRAGCYLPCMVECSVPTPHTARGGGGLGTNVPGHLSRFLLFLYPLQARVHSWGTREPCGHVERTGEHSAE